MTCIRPYHGGALALLLLAACSGDASAPVSANAARNGDLTTLQGRVMGVAFTPESTYVGVGGVTVTLIRIGPLPVDTFPPVDSGMPPDISRTQVRMASRILFDPLPGDTLPSDTMPPPPPPPPPTGCGRQGDTLATTTTDGDGSFKLERVEDGIYDLLAQPGEQAGFRKGFACGVWIKSGTQSDVTLFVPAGS